MSRLSLLQLLFPPRCLFCGEPVPLRGGCTDRRCSAAASAARLAAALPHGALPAGLCGAVCSFRYDRCIARATARYKFRGFGQYRFPMAEYLAADCRKAGIPPAGALVCWVPSWQGRNRHAQQLARETAKRLELPCLPLLVKTRKTEKQHRLSAEQRQQNLKRAFLANAGLAAGRDILLVDDVLTTGATLAACAEALREAGAARVFAAVFACSERTAALAGFPAAPENPPEKMALPDGQRTAQTTQPAQPSQTE